MQSDLFQGLRRLSLAIRGWLSLKVVWFDFYSVPVLLSFSAVDNVGIFPESIVIWRYYLCREMVPTDNHFISE